MTEHENTQPEGAESFDAVAAARDRAKKFMPNAPKDVFESTFGPDATRPAAEEDSQKKSETIIPEVPTNRELNLESAQFFKISQKAVEDEGDEAKQNYIIDGSHELKRAGDPKVKEKIALYPEEYALGLARVAGVKFGGDNALKMTPEANLEGTGYEEACRLYSELVPQASDGEVSKSVLGKIKSAVGLLNQDPDYRFIESGVPEEWREMSEQEILDELVPQKNYLAVAMEKRAREIPEMNDAQEEKTARADIADALSVLAQLDAYEKQLQRKIDEEKNVISGEQETGAETSKIMQIMSDLATEKDKNEINPGLDKAQQIKPNAVAMEGFLTAYPDREAFLERLSYLSKRVEEEKQRLIAEGKDAYSASNKALGVVAGELTPKEKVSINIALDADVRRQSEFTQIGGGSATDRESEASVLNIVLDLYSRSLK